MAATFLESLDGVLTESGSSSRRKSGSVLTPPIDRSRFLRQTVIFSSIASPDINALLKKSCHNISGIIKATKTYTGIERNAVGMVSQVCAGISPPCPIGRHAFFFRFSDVSNVLGQVKRRTFGLISLSIRWAWGRIVVQPLASPRR